jgi:hypothetical protein
MKKRAKKSCRCVNPDVPGGCPNRSTQGRFVGDLCAPCHELRRRSQARAFALSAVLGERTRQDRLWGGANHDDRHTLRDWHRYLLHQCRRIGELTLMAKLHGRSLAPSQVTHTQEDRLVKVAALAFAALESVYRVRGPFGPEDLALFAATKRKKARRKSR